ncbi:arginine N-succinyltransferase [Endozoicomonas numazuensis]|uniref:Arginine N-succinyltransferase n=1 Tax=Endozoicomonas numazuensis TaxID=1137799 RepID=A0A081NL22_9GAMM|nr:arginine N-succinyltransferase [Endozoicomonas numazuensis]KEQ19145.1 arginine N-succinyltransferase [Endozoicomonas numazuensis]
MMIIRPIKEQDHDALWQIAQITGVGFSSLQPDPEMVQKKLDWAVKSFRADKALEEAYYLFVMEDTETGKVVGVTGIESAVGLKDPWYNYKVNTQVHASRELDVYTRIKTLTLCSDYTGHSELCTLFLTPEFRKSYNGHLLSKCRFLFMAAHEPRFDDSIIAELRGYSDEDGESPFWEALGRHFFAVDFVEADQQVSRGKSFIAELMPRNPIYTNLLPAKAQSVIGQTHQDTVPARKLLESEGFRYTGYIDIFDGGPVLETQVDDIRAVRDSRRYRVRVHDSVDTDETVWLIANSQFRDFRCMAGHLSFEGLEFVNISRAQAEALNVQEGDELRVVPLFNPQRNSHR